MSSVLLYCWHVVAFRTSSTCTLSIWLEYLPKDSVCVQWAFIGSNRNAFLESGTTIVVRYRG